MATRATQAGTITRETMIPIQRIGLQAAATIKKGQVCIVSETGFLEVAQTTDAGPFYVALEDAANTASGAGNADVDCPCAVPGHYVTVVAGTAASLTPGRAVVVSTTSPTDDGKVIVAPSSAAANVIVGWYNAEEGGAISKATGTPYLESYSDDENFDRERVSGDDAVIEIRLGAF